MFGTTEILKEDRPWAPPALAEDASGINTMMRKKQNKDNGLTHWWTYINSTKSMIGSA